MTDLSALQFGQRVTAARLARRFIGDPGGVHETNQPPQRGRYEPPSRTSPNLEAWPGSPVSAPAPDNPRFRVEPPLVAMPDPLSRGSFRLGVEGAEVRWRRLDIPAEGTVVGIVRRGEGSVHQGSVSWEDGSQDQPYFSSARTIDLVEILLDHLELRRGVARFALVDPEDLRV